jgi:hypothetical protein
VSDRVVTPQQVADIGRCQGLLPREADFVGRKGYRRTTRPDGSYAWRYRFQQNVGGKRTRAGHEVLERMTPFIRADTERHAKLEAKRPRAALKDRDGGVRYLDPALADDAARRNGWSHNWRARGNTVERGVDGMLFRCAAGAWEPLGVNCLGAPLRGTSHVPRRGIQHDPSGRPWRWIAGEWRRVT